MALLDPYHIIRRPIVTEKGLGVKETQGTRTLYRRFSRSR
jgi:ribosomal protein L23